MVTGAMVEGCGATSIQIVILGTANPLKSLARLCLESCPFCLSQMGLTLWGLTSLEMLILTEKECHLASAPGDKKYSSPSTGSFSTTLLSKKRIAC